MKPVHRRLAGVLMLGLLAAFPLAAQNRPAADPDQDEEEKEQRGVRFLMKKRPSLRLGKVLRVDFRAKIQTDFRGYSPELETEEGLFQLHRARIGVEGRFLKHFEFEVERELRETQTPWRDVYVNFRYFRRFQIKAGRYKVPFGREQLTGATDLDFVYRSLIASYLAPARDLGIMVHGRLFNRGLSYDVGLFKQDGDKARTSDNRGTGERTFAGRLTGQPLRLLSAPALVKNLEVGGAFTSSPVPEGLKGLRGRTIAEETFFPHVYVRGPRLRLGAEMSWMPGPFSLQGEFIHVQEERRGQGLRGENLPDLISRGWYLTGTWVVTGEKKVQDLAPRKEFLTGRGAGALELAARYEQLRFGSGAHPGRPFRGPRAANILGNSDRAWTFGLTWIVNRWVKIQANAIREKIEDPQRSAIFGRNRFWTRVARVQFAM